MKNVSKLIGLALAAAALFLSACTKKPVRSTADATQTGPSSNTINPESLAVAGDNVNLTARDANAGTLENETQSVVEPVHFALDRFAVAPAERPKIEAAKKWLADNPDKSLVLVGHCDWRGTAEYNLGLGDRRANSVKRYLESLGADPKRLETLSKGSTDAKQAGGESEWAKDRRVDFIVLKR
jgi:peptidoglycan-associated lipoprotein